MTSLVAGLILFAGCGSQVGVTSTESSVKVSPSGSPSVSPSPVVSSSPVPTPSASPGPISAGYSLPRSKQGVSDGYYHLDETTLDARYRKLDAIGVGIKIYNFWWSGAESSDVASSPQPVNCPSGYEMFPPSAAEKEARGFKRYRCISQSHMAIFDRMMSRDQALGIQSAVVLWSAPERYRYPGCAGAPWAGSILKEGCVPRDDAMDDFEDYIGLIAYRYDGKKGFGKVHHFVIWNENASGTWFDYSPIVKTRGPVSFADRELWIEKYANMLKRAHSAVQRNTSGVMLYASTDMLWETPSLRSDEVSHIGTRLLLEGLWNRLGVSVSWSVAVHPYGDPSTSPDSKTYGFKTLNMVSNYQIAWLNSFGKSPSLEYPHAYLIASEQGWPQSDGIMTQARNICHAHDAVMKNSWVIGTTHNYFHSTEPHETDGGAQSGQGAFYGLLPYAVPADLSTMFGYPTGLAYGSTQPRIWGKYSDHFCCGIIGKGCPSSGTANNVIGTIDGTVQREGRVFVRGWACSPGYTEAVDVHLYAGGPAGSGSFIAASKANLTSEAAVGVSCGVAGAARRFEIEVSSQSFSSFQNQLLWVHAISPFGAYNSAINRSGEVRLQ